MLRTLLVVLYVTIKANTCKGAEDLYAELGLKYTTNVDAIASTPEIEDAYHTVVAIAGGTATARMNTAREVLTNPTLRQMYDNLHDNVVTTQEREARAISNSKAAVEEAHYELDLVRTYREELEGEEVICIREYKGNHKFKFHRIKRKAKEYERKVIEFKRDAMAAEFSIWADSGTEAVEEFEAQIKKFSKEKSKFWEVANEWKRNLVAKLLKDIS